MSLTLESLRACMEGAAPSVMATSARDGTPNVTYISQVFYVDPSHVALSFQFFSKTRKNVLENPRARLLVWHPETTSMARLELRYLRTESEGPIFERMRAMLSGIASHTGMAGVFRLLGADVYQVLSIQPVARRALAPARPRPSRLSALRAAAADLSRHPPGEGLYEAALDALRAHFGVTHAMLLAFDPARRSLYAIATLGYDRSGVGAEIALGAGVAGVAARERVPIRLTHLGADRSYLAAVRASAARDGLTGEAEVPWPGLRAPGSQLAIPLLAADELTGVLFVESPDDGRFDFEDEDALSVYASLLGSAMLLADERGGAEAQAASVDADACAPDAAAPASVRHYRADDSVFLDDAYVIKGVAGAILWAMLSDYVATGKTGFTNRELRLDPRIGLPSFGDNLEARLVLLTKRLAERDACLRLVRVGRGRLQLEVSRALELREIG